MARMGGLKIYFQTPKKSRKSLTKKSWIVKEVLTSKSLSSLWVSVISLIVTPKSQSLVRKLLFWCIGCSWWCEAFCMCTLFNKILELVRLSAFLWRTASLWKKNKKEKTSLLTKRTSFSLSLLYNNNYGPYFHHSISDNWLIQFVRTVSVEKTWRRLHLPD